MSAEVGKATSDKACNCMCGATPICVACGTDEKVRRFETTDGPVHLCRECAIA